ncbi:colipase isoform X1 [Tachyglossus aculeatus]|uniref:colipase isoform X1 n=1 Tax=Tachyglossus aculeatus TaxID=9261 RepID=UPI0018F5F515|nr:colipase isoform X1 [Tachyglossus aculeatus]
MKAFLLLLLLCLALGLATAAPQTRGLITNLKDGELCLQSFQCKSKCCQRDVGLNLARCSKKAAENSECSPKTIYDVYHKCPCEQGLTCETDWTIIGAITNTNYGICLDDSRSKQ